MKRLRLISILLALFTVSQTLACGDTAGGGTETTDPGPSDQTTAEDVKEYEFSRKWAGQELHILNPYDIYSMHSQLDRETISGEALDDAFYNRCRRLESEMGITLVEDNTYMISGEINEFAQKMIMSNDDTYDVMYISTNGIYPIVKSNGLTDLKSLEGLGLDKDWWQGGFNEKLEMNGSLYSAVGSAHLMYIDSLWGLFFNEDMMNDLKLELPYELVREGKWTTDAMLGYQKAAASLNGDESFTWDDNGKSVYGMSGGMEMKLLAGCAELLLEKDGNDVIFSAGSEHFYDACDKIAAMVTADGGIRYTASKSGLSDGEPGNYITTFETERALFVNAEVCKTGRFRVLDFTYGILPSPKYDEAQESYYASPFDGCPMMTIPVTAKDTEFSAAAMDALSYISYNDVFPIYTEITLETKGLRNDASIEMLGIILDACCPDLTYYYSGITNTFANQLQTAIRSGAGGYASIIASNKEAIEEALEKINS